VVGVVEKDNSVCGLHVHLAVKVHILDSKGSNMMNIADNTK